MSDLKQYLNVYEFETKLKGSDDTIKYKGLSTNSIKKLLVYENENDPLNEENVLDHFINLSVLNEDFDVDEIHVVDRYYLLVKIREATKGSIFEYQYSCPSCGKRTPQSIDLDELIINKPQEVTHELKLGSLTFKMDFPLRKTQKEVLNCIDKNLSDREKRVEIGLADIASHVNEIQSPDGKIEIDYKDLINYIGELPESELSKIDEWKSTNNFGIQLEKSITCTKCGHESIESLSLSDFFS